MLPNTGLRGNISSGWNQPVRSADARVWIAPDVPVAVIENAARANMRVLRAPLAALPELVERERVKSPALIIIGEVTARNDAALAQIALEAQA